MDTETIHIPITKDKSLKKTKKELKHIKSIRKLTKTHTNRKKPTHKPNNRKQKNSHAGKRAGM